MVDALVRYIVVYVRYILKYKIKRRCLSYDYQKNAPYFVPIPVFFVTVRFEGDYMCRVISNVIVLQ